MIPYLKVIQQRFYNRFNYVHLNSKYSYNLQFTEIITFTKTLKLFVIFFYSKDYLKSNDRILIK